MNVDRNIKLLLLKLNKQGKETSLIKIHKYNKEFDSVGTYYKLTFWKKIMVRNRKGELVEKNVPDTHEFTKGIDLLKYMVVKSNERKT
jgi:hypothetical protein